MIFISPFNVGSEEKFKLRMSDIYKKFSYITKKLDERNLKIFEDIVFEKKEEASSYFLKPLMKILKEYYNKNVILLIDEFDAPLVKGHKKRKYKDIYHLLDGFYEEILKGNE